VEAGIREARGRTRQGNLRRRGGVVVPALPELPVKTAAEGVQSSSLGLGGGGGFARRRGGTGFLTRNARNDSPLVLKRGGLLCRVTGPSRLAGNSVFARVELFRVVLFVCFVETASAVRGPQ
jgi:hypothetical protein